MDKDNKKAGIPAKSLLFLLPLGITAAFALVKLFSLPPTPTELPEKLAYDGSTSRPDDEHTPTPSQTHESSATASVALADTPSPTHDAEAPEHSSAAHQIPGHTASAETPTPRPTDPPAVTQPPISTTAPQHTSLPSTSVPTNAPTATPNAKPSNAPTAAPTAKPTAAPTLAPTEAPGKYIDGTYTASSRCTDGAIFDYMIEVKISIRGGYIESVNAVRSNDASDPEFHETNEMFLDMALNGTGGSGLRQQIITNNGPEGIDVVSGATFSSNAIKAAAESAITKAQKSISNVFDPAIIPEIHIFGAKESEE